MISFAFGIFRIALSKRRGEKKKTFASLRLVDLRSALGRGALGGGDRRLAVGGGALLELEGLRDLRGEVSAARAVESPINY